MQKSINPSGYNFEDLITNNALYVDKTEYIHKLVSDINQSTYFLSRPRRFGKSLTISTLKCVFEGKKDLFKDLKLEHLDYDWKVYPIINLNMSQFNVSSCKNFERTLCRAMNEIAESNNVTLLQLELAGELFQDLIKKLAAKSEYGKCVLLIDEYDFPLVDNIYEPHLLEIRKFLENFYIQIKVNNHLLRFTFMAGVTKFSKVNIFSKLNHLFDISFSSEYATMLGYTQVELETNFGEHLKSLSKKQDISYFDFMEQIKLWYNGFRYCQNAETVYNPISIAYFIIEQGKFENYWFNTGSTSFLPKLVAKCHKSVIELLEEQVSSEDLNSFDVTNIDIRVLMLQTGYLTIKSGRTKFGKTFYELAYPNFEVELSFNEHLLPLLSNTESSVSDKGTLAIIEAFVKNDIETVVKELKCLLAAIPYTTHTKQGEDYYRNIMFVIFKLIGARINAEFMTNKGRIDSIIETDKNIYILEYKINQTAQAAIDQIIKNGYAEMFVGRRC